MKRLVIIVIIVVVAAGILYLGFLFRSQSPAGGSPQPNGGLPNTQNPSGDQTGGGTLPGASFSGLSIAVDQPVLDYFVDENKTVSVISPDGGVLKISTGQPATLSSSTVSNLARASFSADGKKLLAVFTGGESIFDMEKTVWQPLPAGIGNPAWGPNGGILAYFANGALATLDTEAKNPKSKVLTALRDKDAELEWPGANTLFIKEPPTAFEQSSVWTFSMKNSVLAPVMEDQLGLDTKWSDGSLAIGIAFTANRNNQGGSLALVDQNGKTTTSLPFLTLPEKCTFYNQPAPVQSSSTASSSASTTLSAKPYTVNSLLICAIPRDRRPLDLNPLPDAYLKKALYTNDDIYSIDPANGSLKAVFNDKTKNIDASDLKVFGKTLYFVNRYDKKLYSLPLPQ